MYLFVKYLVNWFQYFSPCSVAVVAVAKVLAGIEKHTHPHMYALAVSQKRDWTTQSAHRAPLTPFATTKQTPPSPPHCRWAPKCVAYSATARFFFCTLCLTGIGIFPNSCTHSRIGCCFCCCCCCCTHCHTGNNDNSNNTQQRKKKWKKLCHVNYWLTPARRQKCHGLKLLYSWAERIIFI